MPLASVAASLLALGSMTATTKLVLSLIVLYVAADVLLKLALRFEPWLAVGLVPVGWLFFRQAIILYRERRRKKAPASARKRDDGLPCPGPDHGRVTSV